MLTVLSCAVLLIVVRNTPQGIYSDSGWQIRAVQQYLRHDSPTINDTIEPNPVDLTQNVAEWNVYWTPGNNILIYPLISGGRTISQAVRAIATISILLGSVGWVFWFSMFDIPPLLLIALSLFFPWLQYVSNNLFLYSAEALRYAISPWLMLLALQLGEHWKRHKRKEIGRWMPFIITAFGFGMGFAFILKNNAIFVSLALFIYLCLIIRCTFSWRSLSAISWIGLLLVLPAVILTAANIRLTGVANYLSTTGNINIRAESLLYLVSYPALITTDSAPLLQYLLFNLAKNVPGEAVLAIIGLPIGLLFGRWVIKKQTDPAGTIAQIVLGVHLLAMFVIWTFSSAVSIEARHFAPAGFAVLPIIFQQGYASLKRVHRLKRVALSLVIFLFIVLPFLYGVISVLGKVARTSSSYIAGPSGLYNPLLSDTDNSAVIKQITESIDIEKDILYVTDPISALDLPGRVIIRHADFTDFDVLQKDTFISPTPIRIHLVLPSDFELNGKGDVIRGSFVQAGTWTKKAIAKSDLTLWSADLVPR